MLSDEDRQTIRHIAAQQRQTARGLCQARRAQDVRLRQTLQELVTRQHHLWASVTQWCRTRATCCQGLGQPPGSETAALITLLAHLTRLGT